MAGFHSFTGFLLLSFAAFLLPSHSNLIKVPRSPRAAGVFMLLEGGKYTFNFTAARAACLFWNVSMATRAQVERAQQRGLETCKFGWIAEQIAVVPRLTPDEKCGKAKTGVVKWYARAAQPFGVFCFNASDLEETPNRTTTSPQSPTLPTTLPTTLMTTLPTKLPTMLMTMLTRPARTSMPANPPLGSTTKSSPSRKSITTKVPEQTSFTTCSATIPTSTTPQPSSTHIPTSLSHRVNLTFSTSALASSLSVSSESVTSRPTSSEKPSLGDVPTALIVLGVVFLLLTAAGIVWYCKLNAFTFRSQVQQKDDIETEMWKQSDSEVDLRSQHEGEEEESDRKYSSEITLCVNPDIKTNSSE